MDEIFGIPTPLLFGQVLLGLINGAFYALLSLGLAVIFGMLNVINFTHGAQYMMGAFGAWMLLTWFGVPFWAALVIVPSEATYDLDADGDQTIRETRTYLLYVFTENMRLGTETQAQINVAPYFSRVRDYFAARPGLELDTAADPQDVVYEARLLGDRGFQAIPYPGGENSPVYAGIEFRLQVIEVADISYQD